MEIVSLLIGGLVIYLLWKVDDERSKNKNRNKPTKGDEFLEELEKHPDLYQHFFERIEKTADGKTWAKYIGNVEFAFSDEAFEKIQKEEEKLENIYEEAKTKGLNQVVLLVLYLQYLIADPLFDQDKKKSFWVSVSRNRKSVDSFPDHNYIVNRLSKYGYISDE